MTMTVTLKLLCCSMLCFFLVSGFVDIGGVPRKGCELINEQALPGEKLENFDAVLDVMDMDNNQSVDINEFFEVSCVPVDLRCTQRRW